MISIQKLKTLKEDTLKRKLQKIIEGFEEDLIKEIPLEKDYVVDILKLLTNYPFLKDISLVLPKSNLDQIVLFNHIKHAFLRHLNTEASDWDFKRLKALGQGFKKFPLHLYLEDIRSPFNLGSIFRTAEAFGLHDLYISEDCPSLEHPRVLKTAMGCSELLKIDRIPLRDLPKNQAIFALELGGTPIEDFNFPKEGIALIGSEELGLSPEALALADASLGRVSIPLYGAKNSLNASIATGILLDHWTRNTK